jgi:hypothetical protein
MHPDHGEPSGDPRIFENPLEAGIELAYATERKLPQLRQRSRNLLLFGIFWTLGLIALSAVTGANLWGLLTREEGWPLWETVKLVSLLFVLVPSMGLGLTLMFLSLQETRFLPHLDASAKAMGALGSRPRGDQEALPGKEGAGKESKMPIAGIVGSALRTGDLVGMVERMTTVSRAVLYSVLLGMGYMMAVMVHGLLSGSYITLQLVLELVVFSVFVGPAFMLLSEVARDQAFYRYYIKRHRALAEVTAVGVPPVPKGKTHIERFDSFFRNLQGVKTMLNDGGVEKDVAFGKVGFSRLYSGVLDGRRSGILVRELDRLPNIADLEGLLDDAVKFGVERHLRISRVVGLVTAAGNDISDRAYDHLIELGGRTRAGECALQLVMEVDGAYSLVPYVAL